MEPHSQFDYDQVSADLGELEKSSPNEYREASLRFLRVIHVALDWAFTSCVPTPEIVAVMLATGHPRASGRSMSDWAGQLGVHRALISTLSRRFCREAGLPPSAYMRSDAAAKSARRSRERYVEEHKSNENRNDRTG